MPIYRLYVHSGPRKQKTYIHVVEPDVLGCAWYGPTTDAALQAAPAEIREFLRYVKGHGEAVDPDAEIGVEIGEENYEGGFLGSATFPAVDGQGVSLAEAARYTARWEHIRADIAALVEPLPPIALSMSPQSGTGRALRRIIGHVLESEAAYLSSGNLKIAGLSKLAKQAEQEGSDINALLREMRAIVGERLRAMTEEECRATFQRGQTLYSAHRMFRSLLGHGYEHYREIRARLAEPSAAQDT